MTIKSLFFFDENKGINIKEKLSLQTDHDATISVSFQTGQNTAAKQFIVVTNR